MGDPRTIRPEIIGIEVGRVACRGVRVDARTNEVVAVGEVPFGPHGIDRDGVIEPSVVAVALDTLVVRLGIDDRSSAKVGLSIGPRNAGVGSGAEMNAWLQAQATRLGQPLVCSGGLGLAFVPIRSVDQAVKTAFDIGLDLFRVDLAPVAAVRAVGDQVDDLVCVGSGRGWQARMRDFEVLEAMENHQVGPEEPISFHAADGSTSTLARYGWVDLSADLVRSQQVDVGRLATAAGVAIGVLYNSPANLLDGKVINGGRPAAPTRAAPERAPLRAEHTIQLGVIEIPATAAPATARPAVPDTTPAPSPAPVPSPAPAGSSSVSTLLTEPAPQRVAPGVDASSGVSSTSASVVAGEQVERSGWGEDRVAVDDPINLFSPETDADNMLGRRRFPLGFVLALALLVVLAVGLGLAYLYG